MVVRRKKLLLWTAIGALALAVGCGAKGPGPDSGTPHPATGVTAAPPAASCAPGQVNAKGVGKVCHQPKDCAGLWANFCDIAVSTRRPPLCSRMCDDQTDCGENAMCGILNGVRHCYPSVCTQWNYTPGCEKTEARCRDAGAEKRGEWPTEPNQRPKHAGAVICTAGIAWSADGYGLRCDKSAPPRDGIVCKGKKAGACQATFNPDGPDFCDGECWQDSACGELGYCGYQWPVKSFSLCWPRCPEAAHRAITAKPDQLDVCQAEAGVVPIAKNAAGVGKRCATNADCAGNAGAQTCGLTAATTRKADVCTMGCQTDADCGHNAVCADLDFNVSGDGKASGHPKWCVPACWAW